MNLEGFQSVACNHRPVASLLLGMAALAAAISAVWLRRRPRACALCLAALSSALALAFSLDDYLHPWDERFHALVGKNLIPHPWMPTLWEHVLVPQELDWGQAHVWLHKPPLALWLIGASIAASGSSELAVRLPSIALLGAMTWAVFRIGNALFDPQVGLLAGLLTAINGQLLDLASGRQATDHPESLFASLICLAVLAAIRHVDTQRRSLALISGALTGLAILTKSLPALLVFGLWVVYSPWKDQPRRRLLDLALGVSVCAALSVPWQLWIHHAFPVEASFEGEYALRHLTEPLEGHEETPLFHLARIPRFFGGLSPLAIAWFLWSRAPRNRTGWLIGLWWLVPYLFFSLVRTRMSNYIMLSAPAILLMIACAFEALVAQMRQSQRPRHYRAAAAILAISLVALPIRYLFVRWKPLSNQTIDQTVARELRDLRSQKGPGPIVLFNEPHPIEAMFYTGYPAYSQSARPQDLLRAQQLGYQVVFR